MDSTFHATTILAVRRDDRAALAGDGQVTLGNTVVKQNARKIRRLYNDSILAGFAGSAADSFALFSRFEAKLEQYRGNLERSAVELAKDWRTDRALRRLEAMLIVLDRQSMFLLSVTGDLIEPDDGVIGIGSGGAFAQAAAKAGAEQRLGRGLRKRAADPIPNHAIVWVLRWPADRSIDWRSTISMASSRRTHGNGAPVLGQLNRQSLEVAAILLELGFETREQRKRIGG